MVEHGATTMWERWNADQMRDQPGMNSYNHYAYGAVAEWIYRYAAGIDTTSDAPGFHIVDLHPNFDERLGSMDLSYDSPYGTIHSAWTMSAGTATWNVTIPANATGRLALPEATVRQYSVDGKPMNRSVLMRTENGQDGQVVFTIPAGRYSFTVRTSPS
jgi:alpha-L-rhamnosidase